MHACITDAYTLSITLTFTVKMSMRGDIYEQHAAFSPRDSFGLKIYLRRL